MNVRRPPPVFKFIVAVLCAGAGWWLWKPLGAYLAITSAGGYGSRFLKNSCLFLRPSTAVVVGTLWGTLMGVFTSLLAFAAASVWWARCLLGIWGLCGVGYVGFGVRQIPITLTNWEEKAVVVQGTGIIAYVLASVLAWLVLWFRH